MTTPGGGNTWGEWEDEQMSLDFDAADVAQQRGEDAYGQQGDLLDQGFGKGTAHLDRYQIPTATSNPNRPRTVAAKFEPAERAVYVVMRPYTSRGTMKTPVVKYYPCSATDWANFRRAYSKGVFILNNWDNSKNYEEVGSTGGFDNFLIAAVGYAQSQQRIRDGIQIGQSTGSDVFKKFRRAVQDGRRVSDVKTRSDRLGGTGRRRSQSAALNDAVSRFYQTRGQQRPPGI